MRTRKIEIGDRIVCRDHRDMMKTQIELDKQGIETVPKGYEGIARHVLTVVNVERGKKDV